MKKRRSPKEIYENKQIKNIMQGEWPEWPSAELAHEYKSKIIDKKLAKTMTLDAQNIFAQQSITTNLSLKGWQKSVPDSGTLKSVSPKGKQSGAFGAQDLKIKTLITNLPDPRVGQQNSSSGDFTKDLEASSAGLSSARRQTEKQNKSKIINAKITNFIDMLDHTTKTAKPVSQMKDFDNIEKIVKENKNIKKGVVRYLEMITSNPKKADMVNSVTDYMVERQAQKQMYKANLKAPEDVARMKEENLQNSLKIANYGRREMWMPDKAHFKPPDRHVKPALIRFDRDGKVLNPDK